MKSVVRTNQMSCLSVLVLVGVSIFGMRCYAAAPNILFIVSDDHGWETCRPTGTILKYIFQRWMLWHVLAYGFRITTLFRFVVLLGHACLPTVLN